MRRKEEFLIKFEYVTNCWRNNQQWHEEVHSHGLGATIRLATQLVYLMGDESSLRCVGVELSMETIVHMMTICSGLA